MSLGVFRGGLERLDYGFYLKGGIFAFVIGPVAKGSVEVGW